MAEADGGGEEDTVMSTPEPNKQVASPTMSPQEAERQRLENYIEQVQKYQDCPRLAVNTATYRLGVMLGLSASAPVVCFLWCTRRTRACFNAKHNFFFFFFQVHERTRACKKHNLQFWHIDSLFRRAVAARVHTSTTRRHSVWRYTRT